MSHGDNKIRVLNLLEITDFIILITSRKKIIEKTGYHENGDFFPLCSLSGLHSILMPHGGLSFPLPQPSDSEATTELVFYY